MINSCSARTAHLRYLVLVLGIFLVSACSGSNSNSNSNESLDPFPQDPALAVYQDPGSGPWELVEPQALIDECGLDPDILAKIDETAPFSYAIVRYGKLCHEFYRPDMPGQNEMAHNFSATKTLAATLVGRAVLMSADLPKPLRDSDRMDTWVDNITFNPDALVGHVLAMVGS